MNEDKKIQEPKVVCYVCVGTNLRKCPSCKGDSKYFGNPCDYCGGEGKVPCDHIMDEPLYSIVRK